MSDGRGIQVAKWFEPTDDDNNDDEGDGDDDDDHVEVDGDACMHACMPCDLFQRTPLSGGTEARCHALAS